MGEQETTSYVAGGLPVSQLKRRRGEEWRKAVPNIGAREQITKRQERKQNAIKPRDTLCIVSEFVRNVPSIDSTCTDSRKGGF
jgi:hypothetical protein